MAVEKICQNPNCKKIFMGRPQPGRGLYCSNACRLDPTVQKANWDNPKVREARVANMKATKAKKEDWL